MRATDMVGKVCGHLTVTAFHSFPKENNAMHERFWTCKCDCGNTVVKRGSTLRNGATKTCGRSCPFSGYRKTSWSKYLELNALTPYWEMQFDEGSQPMNVVDKAAWLHKPCGKVHMVSYRNLRTYLDPNYAAPSVRSRKNRQSHPESAGCSHCHSKKMGEADYNPKVVVNLKEATERVNKKGCDLLHYSGSTVKESKLQCRDCRHKFMATLWQVSMRRVSACPVCKLMVNGCRASSKQIELARFFHPRKSLDKFVNVKVGGRTVDIFLKDKNIAIEYDSYMYHALKDDRPRNKAILSTGTKLWRIRSNDLLPRVKTIKYAIKTLVNTGRKHFRTTLKDWGRGNVWCQKTNSVIASPNSLLLEV